MRKWAQLPLLAFLALPRCSQVRFIYTSKDKYSMCEVSQGGKGGEQQESEGECGRTATMRRGKGAKVKKGGVKWTAGSLRQKENKEAYE